MGKGKNKKIPLKPPIWGGLPNAVRQERTGRTKSKKKKFW